jgi:hypothetical protein
VLLASWNNNNPRVVAGKLREAIEAWEKLQAEGAESTGDPLDVAELDRADRFYPDDGLVLRVNTRDLPREVPQESRWADAWNQDYAWFTRDEARSIVPEDPEPGRTRDVPRPIVERLARFHLLDNVRGQTTPFPARAVEEARMTSRVTEVDGDVVTLRLEGRTRTSDEGRWPVRGERDRDRPEAQRRGMDLELLGFARYDLAQGRFLDFEVVAVGSRWGATRYNGRSRDLDPAPFGVVLGLAGDAHAERVAPEHFWGYGWR